MFNYKKRQSGIKKERPELMNSKYLSISNVTIRRLYAQKIKVLVIRKTKGKRPQGGCDILKEHY